MTAAPQPAAAGRKIGGATIIAGPDALDDAALSRLSKLLTDETSYDWQNRPACEFQPAAAVRFAGVKKTIDLVFCFACDELRVYEGQSKSGPPLSSRGHRS